MTVGDALLVEYVKDLFERLFFDGIQLILKLKNNMKGSIMKVSANLLLREKAIIETINERT
mgnify:CR=1 FL=1